MSSNRHKYTFFAWAILFLVLATIGAFTFKGDVDSFVLFCLFLFCSAVYAIIDAIQEKK